VGETRRNGREDQESCDWPGLRRFPRHAEMIAEWWFMPDDLRDRAWRSHFFRPELRQAASVGFLLFFQDGGFEDRKLAQGSRICGSRLRR